MSSKCNQNSEKSTMFNSISEISPEKESWIIIARVIRLWMVPDFSRQRLPLFMEMVLMDDKGDRIHASVRKTLIYRFQNELTEGYVYSFQYFGVAANGGSYRTIHHSYKLNFQITARVVQRDNGLVGTNIYDFVPISYITGGGYNINYLVDVIGLLAGVGTEREIEKNGTKTKLNVISVEDDGHRIQCTLFGNYVDELNTFLASGDFQNAVVIIQLGKVKTFQDNNHIQNCMGCTKLIFNPICEEADQLRQRMRDNMESPTQTLSQLTGNATVGISQDFLQITSRKSIEGLKDCKQESNFIVLATMKHIIDTEDWWYTACVCTKGVYPDSKMFFCEKCNKHVIKVIPRYCIKVRVIDDTDSTTFVIFDRDAALLLNKSCADMVEAHEKSAHSGTIPKEIYDLVDKTYLFNVEFKNATSSKFDQSFRVKKICSDLHIINKFNDLMRSIDVKSDGHFLGNGKGKEKMVESSIRLAENLMGKFSSAGVDDSQFDEKEGCDLNEEGDEFTPLNPLKRVVPTENSQQKLHGVSELELPLKMLKKNIKIEKD